MRKLKYGTSRERPENRSVQEEGQQAQEVRLQEEEVWLLLLLLILLQASQVGPLRASKNCIFYIHKKAKVIMAGDESKKYVFGVIRIRNAIEEDRLFRGCEFEGSPEYPELFDSPVKAFECLVKNLVKYIETDDEEFKTEVRDMVLEYIRTVDSNGTFPDYCFPCVSIYDVLNYHLQEADNTITDEEWDEAEKRGEDIDAFVYSKSKYKYLRYAFEELEGFAFCLTYKMDRFEVS